MVKRIHCRHCWFKRADGVWRALEEVQCADDSLVLYINGEVVSGTTYDVEKARAVEVGKEGSFYFGASDQ